MGFLCTYRIFVLYSCVFGCIVALLGQAVVANEVVEVNSSVDGILGPVGGVDFICLAVTYTVDDVFVYL
jgi:ABC-type enterochelin transport system permease subunit